jgi:hypothetical protein
MREEPIIDPCQPSPCGPNSRCRKMNNVAICSCLPSYIGSPPGCRPECVVNADCALNKACSDQKCRNPCPNTCGFNARCQVVNHNPICSCMSGFIGDPFIRCIIEESKILPETSLNISKFKYFIVIEPLIIADPIDPCQPSPCGPNSQCQKTNGHAVCSCLPSYVGNPPSCRPECVQNSDCPSSLACINMKCQNPCTGLCGVNAECSVIYHRGICQCAAKYTGDPFTQCSLIPCKNYNYYHVFFSGFEPNK